MLWKWKRGRQRNCEYKKLCLYSFRVGRWGLDAYILKYQADTYLPLHRDLLDGKHWRLNIGWGNNQFIIANYPKKKCGWKIGRLSVYLFRPDLYLHALQIWGKTTKASFGFAKFNNKK